MNLYLGHKSCRRQCIAIHEFHECDLCSTETGEAGLFSIYITFYVCVNNTNVNFSYDYIIYRAFIMETSHDSDTDRAVWVLAKFIFHACHLLQSILIDACVLDSDSGLLQQVQTCCCYLPFILTHKYLMLDSSRRSSALSFNQE